MDIPIAPRINMLAGRLSDLPGELVEPIIEHISLRRVIELTIAPRANRYLVEIIRESRAWGWLFRYSRPPHVGFDLIKSVWIGISRLVLLQRLQLRQVVGGRRAAGLDIDCDYALRKGGPKPEVARQLIEDLELDFSLAVKNLVQGLVGIELRALCIFLPEDPFESDSTSTIQDDATELVSRLESISASSGNTKYWAMLQDVPTEDVLAHRAGMLVKVNPTAEQAADFLGHLVRAKHHLRQAQAGELNYLADLYECHSELLKSPQKAPEQRTNPKHVLEQLRIDAEAVLTRPLRTASKSNRGWFRFRNPTATIIPFDWAMRLFYCVTKTYSTEWNRYPPELAEDLKVAHDGFELIATYGSEPSPYGRIVGRATLLSLPYQVDGPIAHKSLPTAPDELKWLTAMVKCLTWMKEVFPGHAAWFQGVGPLPPNMASFLAKDKDAPKPLLDEADYKKFINSEPAEIVARQMKADATLCDMQDNHELPSLLALYLPRYSEPRAKEIATELVPRQLKYDITLNATRQTLYEDTIRRIRNGLKTAIMTGNAPHPDGVHLVYDQLSDPNLKDKGNWNNVVSQFRTGKWSETPDMAGETSVKGGWDAAVEAYASALPVTEPRKTCYICNMVLERPHKTLSSMCEPCGDFNLAGSAMSMPQNLHLAGRTALVTGGRINLGYHTALRLLRCGASVIVSTRYPQDAATRYASAADYEAWKDRLKVVGADFRTAKDAFDLVNVVRDIIVSQWGGRLHILVNNAAQTLTDSIEAEKKAVDRELLIGGGGDNAGSAFVNTPYTARIRAGVGNLSIADSPDKVKAEEAAGGASNTTSSASPDDKPPSEMVAAPPPSSWVQSLSDIPYEDVISAHSVNTFVPLILMRELLPLMARDKKATNDNPDGVKVQNNRNNDQGYIVNVSSREGIFESRPDTKAKSGKHVHTNMSKAGLNMITETEAATAWKKHRVAINTVDPGYMSAAPEYEKAHGGERPIGWEDGAGRVLWPVAMGEAERKAVWGRFLKHYGAVRVDVRFGRG